MTEQENKLVGTWRVSFKQWKWIYTFTANKKVTWRDPLNGEGGAGSWGIAGKMVFFSWLGSTAKETWNVPSDVTSEAAWTGWYDATYGVGAVQAKKEPEIAGPLFVKPPGTGKEGSSFTDVGQLWRQTCELGGSATVALKNSKGTIVGLNNERLAKLVKWYFPDEDLLYVDIVPTSIGDANLEARINGTVRASIQISVGQRATGAIYVDDFASSFYHVSYKDQGGDYSKVIALEYKDSVAIEIEIKDILDTHTPAALGPQSIGEGGRRFPTKMDIVTTPRLHAAKMSAIATMQHYYAEFLEVSRDAIFFLLTVNPLVAPIPTKSATPVPRAKVPKSVVTIFEGAGGATTTLRPRASQTQLREMLRNPNDWLVWGTREAGIVESKEISFTGATNPGATNRVHLFRGTKGIRGVDYGPNKVAIKYSTNNVRQVNGPEYAVDGIEASEGFHFFQEDLNGL